MGLCFSKKEVALTPEKQPPESAVVEAPPAEKKQVFVITHNANKSTAAAGEKENRGETPTKKASREVVFEAVNAPVATVPVPTANFRTSSCTKEEVEAILIQCGRLSRSSSGKVAAGSESGIGYRKYSGSKRSFDFDNEERDQEEWGEMKTVSRPSPCRRTPGRERSGSRERGSGGGGRRVSRSPGRRSDIVPASSAVSERSKQPAKMVAVPPSSRENGRGLNRRGNNGRGSGGEMVAARTASPRSRSPATNARILNENACPQQPPCLSRSSSRKADQSPFRRNPMAELDENCPRTNQNAGGNFNKIQKTREGEEGIQNKPIHFRSQKFSENEGEGSRLSQRSRGDKTEHTTTAPKNNNNLITHSVPESQPPIESTAADAPTDRASSSKLESQIPRTITRSRSSRRSSRDLDQALGLLEDIQAYNQQHPDMAVSLPACISKACSILEAVADLNSTTTSESRSCYLPLKPVPVALESIEPQESAGSNSFVSHEYPELNSIDSISKSSSDQQLSPASSSHHPVSQCQPPAVTSRSGGGGRVAPATPNEKRREFYRRNQQIHRGSGRACSAATPVAVSL
ncbi:uncharacterized protein LOC141814264 [Curcuma longa]|uniref:uncharacterized protein LOC141814264 n=1 Tax=Curcuma longa TaxID=136217 RepID=UPI003D9DF173